MGSCAQFSSDCDAFVPRNKKRINGRDVGVPLHFLPFVTLEFNIRFLLCQTFFQFYILGVFMIFFIFYFFLLSFARVTILHMQSAKA